jgi:hypothetical protein
MARRALLNCWLVAMWLWLEARGRSYMWVRRAHSFFGLLPHFGYAERTGLRSFRSIEYRPPKGRLWSKDDLGLVFRGHYAVTHFKVVSVRRWATREQALADIYFPKTTKN